MKNYELIAELSKLPAGDEVSFDGICMEKEVDVQEDDGEEIYIVSKKICNVDADEGRIILS